jgi:dolichyl-phosphate beta-glucosyltransferase
MPSNIVLSVVLPAYNEANRVGKTLRSIDRFLKKQPYNYEIIVVDDGSKDATPDVVRTQAWRSENLRILRHERNYGKGWAVRTGMLNARGRYRLFMDADGSTDIKHWHRVQSALDQGADIVVGSRHVAGSKIDVHQAAYRVFLGHIFRLLVKRGFRLSVLDTQNGFKAFTADAAERVFRRQRVPGWAFDVEILSIAENLGYRAAEVPVTWIDDNRSRMTMAAMPRMLAELFRIKIGALQPQVAPRVREEVPQWA